MKPQLLVFKEATGNITIGEQVKVTDQIVIVRNPATLFIQPNAKGQLNVQLFPVIFGELLSGDSRKRGTEWEYAKASIAVATDLELDENLCAQYNRIFNPSPIITPEGAGTIKLFDE